MVTLAAAPHTTAVPVTLAARRTTAAARPHYGGGAAHFAPAGRAAPHYNGGTRFAGGGGVNRYTGAPHYAVANHGNWNHPGGAHGQWNGNGRWGGRGDPDHDRHGWVGTYWGGGYWGNAWWPAAYYGLGFSWFLPVLPGVYATYWYGGIPYYYANDVYYTWDPGYDGYVATDPPPVAGDDNGAGAGVGAANAPDASGQVFMYPQNGQSDEQQAQDRHACEQWAASETASEPAAQGYDDYRRAMMACAEGRGYSVQ